jgi:hypothetical protein
LRFDLLLGVGLGDAVGETFFFFGEAAGDGVGVAFFFRCLRPGVGVGAGAKAFLIFVPNDSSAASAVWTAPNIIAMIRSHFMNSEPGESDNSPAFQRWATTIKISSPIRDGRRDVPDMHEA